MKAMQRKVALNLLFLFSVVMFNQAANSTAQRAFVNIPETYIRFPSSGQIIFAGITIVVKDEGNSKVFENNKYKISQELSNVAKDFAFGKLAVPADRASYDAALKKAIQDLVGNSEFDILFNKIEISKMPQPSVKWSLLKDLSDSTYYFDPNSISRQSDFAKIWLLADYKTPDKFQGKPFSSVVIFLDIDCTKSMKRSLLTTAYERKQAKGRIVNESDIPYEWRAIENASIISFAQKLVCQ